MAESLNKWLLVNYAGYPFTSSSLMPDNGLANLAGVIIAHGGDVEILDYGTVSTVSRMTSPELRNRLTRAWDTLRTCLLYTSPSPRDRTRSRMPSSA